MIEEWREIPGFPGNEVSNLGNLRTYWYKVRNEHGYGTHRELRDYPRPIPMHPDDNGYYHVNLYCDLDGKRYTRKTHVLVALAFLPLPDDYGEVDYTVDHINSGPLGKLGNSVENLQWLSRPDNIRKAYRDGMCDDRIRRQCKAVMLQDLWTGDWTYYDSIKDAANDIGIKQNTLAQCIASGRHSISHYIAEYADWEDRLLYGGDGYDYETGLFY